MNLFHDGEQIVERMQREAKTLVDEVMREFSISHVVCGYSGGDDSIVSTHWAVDFFSDALTMIGDTKIGLQTTRNHQDKIVDSLGFDACRVSASVEGPPANWSGPWIDGETAYEELIFNHGFPGPGMHGRTYQRLKQRAFRKVKSELGHRKRGSRILVVSGVRGDESAIRAGYDRAHAEEAKEGFVWFNPFYYATSVDFEAYRQEFGLPRNPAKKVIGISGECCCGAFATPGERGLYAQIEPTFDAELSRLEKKVAECGFAWPWGTRPTRAFMDMKRGQSFLFDDTFDCQFTPACVGCLRKVAHEPGRTTRETLSEAEVEATNGASRTDTDTTVREEQADAKVEVADENEAAETTGTNADRSLPVDGERRTT